MKFNKGDEDEASFYRILLSDSEYLRLPSAFAEKYLEKDDNEKQSIVLQTKSCVEWRVEYLRIEDRCYFMGGWLKFRNENRLQPLTRDFMKDVGIRGYDTLRLENKKGRIWDVRLRKGKVNKTPHIGSGWFDFVKDNKVKVGDTCGFNHVQDNLLRVHVVKKRGRHYNKRPRATEVKSEGD